MTRDRRLLLGPLAGVVLFVGVAALPARLPGYDPVRQTVSEIGEAGSAAQLPFTLMLCSVALGVAGFAAALGALAARDGLPRAPAWLTAAMAVSAAGVGLFAFPHPLHNVFGLSELVGYQAPLALALAWRGRPGLASATRFSAVMAAIVAVMIALNLVTLARDSAVWAQVKPVYGLVQRGLFAAWFAWCAGLGLILARGNASRAA